MKLANWLRVSGLALPLACAGGSGGGTYSSGVPPTKAANAVTTAEAMQICSSIITFYAGQFAPQQKSAECKVTGLTVGGAAPAGMRASVCEKAIADCLKEPQSDPPPDPKTECADATAPSSSCMITVGQYEACINDQVAAFNAAINAIPPCSALDSSTQLQVPQEPPTPASCVTAQQKCPELDLPGA